MYICQWTSIARSLSIRNDDSLPKPHNGPHHSGALRKPRVLLNSLYGPSDAHGASNSKRVVATAVICAVELLLLSMFLVVLTGPCFTTLSVYKLDIR